MLNLKNPKVAIPIVLIAGIFWSFGPYVVRHIDQPETVPWQYLFTRGIVIFLLLNMYLFLEEGKEFYKNYFKVGISGLIGGIGLGTAMITPTDCNNPDNIQAIKDKLFKLDIRT